MHERVHPAVLQNRSEYHGGKLCLSLLRANRRQAVESAQTSRVPSWPAVSKSDSRKTQAGAVCYYRLHLINASPNFTKTRVICVTYICKEHFYELRRQLRDWNRGINPVKLNYGWKSDCSCFVFSAVTDFGSLHLIRCTQWRSTAVTQLVST